MFSSFDVMLIKENYIIINTSLVNGGKTVKKSITIVLLLILLSMVFLPQIALAYKNAYDTIHIYYQPSYSSTSLGGYNLTVYRNKKARTLKDIGCNLFTYAHAIQWLEQTNYSTNTEYLGLLSQLISVCNTPSESQNGYVSYMTNQRGFKKTAVTATKESMKNLFDQGGCVRIHLYWEKYGDDSSDGGHYFLAIGYTEVNDELYLQMIDSSPWSTVNRVECRSYSNIQSITKDSGNKDCQYWIPLSRFTGTKKRVYNNRKAGMDILEGYLPNPNSGSGSSFPEIPTMTDGTAPTSLSNGSSFRLKGTISCKYNITEVRGIVYNYTTGTKIFDIPVTPNSKTYTLGTSGEKINDGIKFGDSRLNNSWCCYSLIVTYDKDGVFCQKYMYDRYFKVGSAANMTLQEPGYFEFICDEEIRTGPAEANPLVRTCSKGTIVYAIGYELNASNNMWLKLSDGNYVFSGDVRRVEGSGSPALVEEVLISTPEGLGGDIEYIGYDDGNKNMVLQAYVLPYDALNTNVDWTISNPNVLRKDSSEKYDDGLTVGHFTIIGVGQTNVTATATDGSGVSNTILVGYYISGLSMPTSSVSLAVGDTWQACPVIVPSIAKNTDLNWVSTNSQVASVDANGVVTAVANGSATIIASPKNNTTGDNNPIKPVSCTINVASAPILSFNNIKYPDTYKISSSGYIWGDNSGTITSRDGLSSVVFNIYDKDGNCVAHYENTQNVKTLTMKSITAQIKMSALTVEGKANFEMIAIDVNGNVLKASVKFTASKTKSTVSGTFNRTYTTPTLLASKSYGNSDYFLYKSSYTWDSAYDFAQTQGGYLATITDSGENEAVAEMLTARSINYAYIGGYYNGSAYVWVSGEDMSYTNWAVNQPDHTASRENYMEIFGTRIKGEREIGQWNDIENTSCIRNYFVVEVPMYASSGSCGENATWTFRNNVLTISGTGAMYDYDSCFDTPWSHYREEIYEVVINSGITQIGRSAFAEFINLQSAIYVPDSVSIIGDYAFSSCEVRIPNSVSQIGICSEMGCYFMVGENNPNYSSVDGTLYNKNKTELIKCNPWATSITIPDSVIKIHYAAFAYCSNLTTISIPGGVTAIPDYAFEACWNLGTVIIPESVTEIGSYAFWLCPNLMNIVIPEKVSSIGWDIFYPYPGIVIFCYDNSAAHTYAVQNDYVYVLLDTPLDHADFVIPANTVSIEEEAFYKIAAKRIKLPESVTSIGSQAFAYCPNLVSIYIPASCKMIALDAFFGVPGLTIYGKEDSVAEYFARNNNLFFVSVE